MITATSYEYLQNSNECTNTQHCACARKNILNTGNILAKGSFTMDGKACLAEQCRIQRGRKRKNINACVNVKNTNTKRERRTDTYTDRKGEYNG
jgi:hypothetical protein